MKNSENQELETLKGLITFAKKEKIARFKYQGFEFELTPDDPNAKELKRLSDDLEYTKNLVMKIKAGIDLKR